MARPRIPIGSHGTIKTKQIKYDPPLWESRTRFRDRSGKYPQVRRTGKSRAAAEAALTTKLNALAREIFSGKITSDTRFETVAWEWHAEFRQKSLLGGKSPTSVRLYRGYLNNDILPRCGALTMAETTVRVLDGIIKAVHKEKSSAAAKSVKSVLGGIGNYAVRTELWDVNRAHQVDEIIGDDPKEVQALDAAQLDQVRTAVKRIADAKQTDSRGYSIGARGTVWAHLPDLIDAAASTGARLGELLALDSDAFGRDDQKRPVVRIVAHIIRGDDNKVTRLAYRKASKNRLILVVPEWSVPLWTRLKLRAEPGGPLFPSMRGGWLHPDGVGKILGRALDEAKFPWVTAHILRKTVGDTIDESGMSAEEVGAQLGNTAGVARKHYTRDRARNDKQAAALEKLGGKTQDTTG